MLWPVQNLLVLEHWYGDQSASFEVSDLDEELYESDSKQFHEEFDTETSAHLKCNHVMFTMSQPDQIIVTILNKISCQIMKQLPEEIAYKFNYPNKTIKDLSISSQRKSLQRKGNIIRIMDPPEYKKKPFHCLVTF